MEANEIKVQKILDSDMFVDQDYPKDSILQQCYVCEESQTSGIKWHKGLGLDTLVSHYEDHAHMNYFMKNRERIQSIPDPIAQSRYLPWHKNYSSYHMEEKIQPFLHSRYKKVRDRITKINKALAGISSESASGTEDSSFSSDEESSTDDYSEQRNADEQEHNLGYAPSEVPSKKRAPDDEISLFKSNFLETDDEKHKRMIENPPNPCKEGGRFCTRFQTSQQALYHYHLYHSKVYRAHNCSQDPSCGRRFHEEKHAREHDCNAHKLEYISPKKNGPFIEEQRAMRSRNDSGRIKETPSLKRRPSPSLKSKREKKNKKKKKQRRIHIISESDDDTELTTLVNKAKQKRKDDSNTRKSSSSIQQQIEGPSAKPKNDDIEQIDLTKMDLNLDDLSETGDFGHIISGNLTTKNIRDDDYRFCPICSKDKIPADKMREHVKTCLTNSSKIYNTFISMRG